MALGVDEFARNVEYRGRFKIGVTHSLTQPGKDKPYPKISGSVGEVPIPKWLPGTFKKLMGSDT